jgi:pimeloyl-ACP methyl ester carboxylesterase
MSQLKLSDGRNFEYEDNGVKSDQAILFLHGTPGADKTWSQWLPQVTDCLAIAASRAGYGKSDRHKGRTVADDLADQQALLDHFHIKEFVSIGWSGGGPHSINMTRDPRSKGAITLAGVAEWGHADLDFLADMGPENEEEFGEALKGEAAIQAWMSKNAPSLKTITGPDLISALGGLIGEADKAALTPERAEDAAKSFRHALVDSFDGWADDDLAFVQKFGFDLGAINKPVLVWQGDDDFMVPKAHGEWLAKHIPTAKLNFVPGHGHISLTTAYRPEIIKQAMELLKPK